MRQYQDQIELLVDLTLRMLVQLRALHFVEQAWHPGWVNFQPAV